MRKLLLSLFSIILTVSSVNAGKVTEQQALQKARQFMKGKSLTVVNTKALSRTDKSDGADPFYIFNADDNGGFVIVSGDDRTESILGYSDTGHVDLSKAPAAFKYWMECYAEQMASVNDDYQQVASHLTRSAMPAIDPMLTCNWSQGYPYNLMAPVIDEQHCVAGCVATALAQVMYYHKWPKTSEPIPGYTTYTKKLVLDELPATTFKWDLMKDAYDYEETGEACDAVGELLRYCGQLCEMDYQKYGSGAGLYRERLINLFKYSRNTYNGYRSYYTKTQWNQLIYDELAARRPVLYSGASSTGGHMFVCDGYDGDGLFHINWGWGSYCDGFFLLSLCNPEGRGTGGGNSSEGYVSGQAALLGFMPQTEHEQLLPQMSSHNVGVGASEYTRTDVGQDFENVQLKGYVFAKYNQKPESPLTVETGWGLYKKDEFVKCLGYNPHTIPAEESGSAKNDTTLTFGASLADGKYYIYQIYRLQGETDWHLCIDMTTESIVAEVSGTQLKIGKIDSQTSSYVIDDVVYSEDQEVKCPLDIRVKLTNHGDVVQHELYFWTQDNAGWKLQTTCLAYLDNDESGEFFMSFIPDVAGTFAVRISSDNKGDDVKYSGSITVADVVQTTNLGVTYALNLLTKKARVVGRVSEELAETTIIPSTIAYQNDVFSVKSIASDAFYGVGAFNDLTISEGVERIGENAFRSCYRMKKVSLPSTIRHIGEFAFASCSQLVSVEVHMENPSAINDNVFEVSVWNGDVSVKAHSSATLYVPVGTADRYKSAYGWKQFDPIYEGELKEETIDGLTYNYVTGTKIAMLVKGEPTERKLTIPAAVHIDGVDYPVLKICKSAFWNKNEIDTLIISEGIRSIEQQAFRYCYSLQMLDLPSTLTQIDNQAFGNCGSLKSVVSRISNPFAINDNVFGTSKWDEDYTVETILPPSATLFVPVGTTAKYKSVDGWKQFPTIYEGELKQTTIGSFSYSYITGSRIATLLKGDPAGSEHDVTIPATIQVDGVNYQVTTIAADAFWNKNVIWNLVVSEGIQTIEKRAFRYCYGLQTVELPSTLTSIGDYAFGSCNRLQSVVNRRKQPIAISSNVFGQSKWNDDYTVETITPPTASLTVPYGCKEAYAGTEGWKEFPILSEMEAPLVETVSITVGASGKTTYCGSQSLDFSYSEEVKAYTATGYDLGAGIIWLTRVKDVPAGTPILVKGAANTPYDVPVVDSQNSYYENMFVGNVSGASIQVGETDGNYVNYYLSGKDGTFKSVNKSVNIGNNKSYLQLPGTFEPAASGDAQSVTVGSAGKASYAAPVDLDFSNVAGLKAFTATGYDKSGTIWLTRVMKVQKGEGLLLKGDANQSYSIPSVAVQSSYKNMFVGNISGATISVGEKSSDGFWTHYYLSGKDGTFKSVNKSVNIGHTKSYLQLPTDMVNTAVGTRGIDDHLFDEEPEVIAIPVVIRRLGEATTGIKANSQKQNANSQESNSQEYFTLQGQRVENPSKGLYIKDGKVVVIK